MLIKSIEISNPAGAFVAAVALLLSLQGCYTYRVIPETTSANRTAVGDTTLYAYFWGLSPPPTVEPKNCDGNGTAKVVVRKTFFHSLLTAITLGVVAPVNLQWECATDGSSGDVRGR